MELPPYLIPSPDGIPWLTLLVLAPLVGMALVGVAALMRLPDRAVKQGAIAWSLVPLGIAVYVWLALYQGQGATTDGTFQLVEQVPWVRAIAVDYTVGVDGISLPLVLLTALMTPVALAATWPVTSRVKGHVALIFLLSSAMLGYFVALNFFFWFIFWEFSLVPAYFLISGWGRLYQSEHDPERRRRNAAFTFFVYTVAGSLGLLLLFQFLYLATSYAGLPTFDLVTLGRLGQGLAVPGAPLSPTTGQPQGLEEIIFRYSNEVLGLTAVFGEFPQLFTGIVFWALFLAFAIKLAVWPFHSWLADTYAEAPISTSILLSAVMSKMGAYGLLRLVLPFVPEQAQFFAPVVGALALVGIVAGAFGALAHVNGDIKRLIAYTSINHMGYVALGIAGAAAAGANLDSRASALNGVVMQLVAHGLSTGALFFLAGALHERTGSYSLAGLGGLRQIMPTFAGLFGVALFANLGLPGLAGFVGEFFIFKGAWATLPLFTALATIGLVVTALALLLMFQRIFLGPLPNRLTALHGRDLRLGGYEALAVAPLLLLLLVLGVYPAPIMNLANAASLAIANVFANF
jgi:NADH-quinone oxidoreductase subunit M